MPQATVVTKHREWTLLTDQDVTGNIRIQNLSSSIPVYLMATADDTTPESVHGADGGAVKAPAEVVFSAPAYTMQTLFPSIADAKRIWAWSAHAVSVSVSYT